MRTRLATPWVFALVLCVPGRSYAQTVSQVAARRQCSTAGVVALSNQLVAMQQCAAPGVFVSVIPHANVTLSSSRLFPYMQATARSALWAASARVNLQVNSMFRTLADQYVLYHSGACGLAARPGGSNHETGVAVDLANWSAALSAMTAAGCRHPYPGNDDVHFDCPGTDRRADSVRAFQRLWNLNNAGDRIAEDGAYGPMTEARISRSPSTGFGMFGCADAGMPDAGVPEAGMPDVGVPDAAAPDVGAPDMGMPDVMRVDVAQDAPRDSASDVVEELGPEDPIPPEDASNDEDATETSLADARDARTCADGRVADGGQCVEPEPGCQCRAGAGVGARGGARSARGALAIVLALVAVAAKRRRRRRA